MLYIKRTDLKMKTLSQVGYNLTPMRPPPLLPGKALALFLLIGILLSACGNNLWGTNAVYQTAAPAKASAGPTAAVSLDPISSLTPVQTHVPSATPLNATDSILTPSPALAFTPTPSLTPRPTPQAGTPGSTVFYTSQSGDSLNVVAIHFGIQPSEISAAVPLSATGFINPGTLLFLPAKAVETPQTPSQQIIPDSELVDSPSAVGFDIKAYVNSAGGKLSSFTDTRTPIGPISGAEGIRIIAVGSSISPRLLLALTQYYTGWVQGQSKPGLDEQHLFGYTDPSYDPAKPSLYQPLRLVIQDLLTGYYGWRAGNLSTLTFPDGSSLRIAPDLNAGSVALQYFFSRHLDYADWLQAINPDTGFLALYKSMFGDPWQRADELGPLFPVNFNQPPFTLPFDVSVPWNLTNGPHPAWEAESAWGALDFAPSGIVGCDQSEAWVVAIAPGQIVRSESSYVVLDLDGDGFEQTGWVVIYQHVSLDHRIAAGTWVNAGDHIGHPSCEGGTATGTHTHIARKYNGEWVAAGGPLPFVLSGWTAHAGAVEGVGTLTKGERVITASQVSEGFSQIIRQPGE
jgi:LasA protease